MSIMISYSQNFEDVILQRVLADVKTGCYLDVGASSPVHESNTVAFYQKGWRGICIDPLSCRSQWEQVRPEDIFVNAAVGDKPGQTTFHIYNKFNQISTTSGETVEHWKQNGVDPDESVTVPVVTLDMVLAQHLGGRELHLLAIDVEGMEKDVLMGLTLEKFRPWVMVIEATVPGMQAPSHQHWEPIVLAAGYQMVYFDGLNRFYLSPEKSALLPRFALPPNRWDDFLKASEIENRKKIEVLEASVAKLQSELAALR